MASRCHTFAGSRIDPSCSISALTLSLEARRNLSNHSARQEQQCTPVEQPKDQLAIFGVTSQILRYPDQQNRADQRPPERSDAADDEDRHQLDHDAEVEKRSIDVIQEVRVEAARERSVDSAEHKDLDSRSNDIDT